MCRRKLFFGFILTLAVISFAVVALWPQQPGVTQVNFDRIENGMTKDEVEAILAEPPFARAKTREPGVKVHMWKTASDSLATVAFSEEGTVIRKSWPADDESYLRKIRRWLFPESKEPKAIF